MSRTTPFALLFALCASSLAPETLAQQNKTYACFETNMGEFCMKFLRDRAPNTVDNFVKYVERGSYDQTFIHRAVNGFVVQGGGYKLEPLGEPIPDDGTIENEFGASNVRGTVAMAKLDGDPNSATTEWFINVGDNSSTLDYTNGGFTVFAEIVRGMDVVDAIGRSIPVSLADSLGPVFNTVPVLRRDPDGVDLDDLVQVWHVYLTDTVEEQPLNPDDDTEERQRIFQCVADWISEIHPTEVCMESNLGNFCMDLMPDVASRTVANFLHYVADGDYDNSIIHRSVPGFVVQGGGFRTKPLFSRVPGDPTIQNEYSTPNTRGTVAMAKAAGAPDSATSEWFVNLTDNSETLGPNNSGGFTVFARVRESDMWLFDQIASLEIRDLSQLISSGAFSEVPLRRVGPEGGLTLDDFVVIRRAYIPGHETNPCVPPKPDAVTEFSKRTFRAPVRFPDGQILEIQFSQPFRANVYLFEPQLYSVRALKDVGQETAEYFADEGLLVIPSVLLPNNTVVYNVRLRMEDKRYFSFVLESFDREPPAGSN